MENTSKALLIVASILIVILLIIFGIRVFNSINDTEKQAQGIGNSISLGINDSTDKLGALIGNLGSEKINLNHSGTIPEGGEYIAKDGTIYIAGKEMPTPQIGDIYKYSDYTYTIENKYGKSWNVSITDRTKTAYDNILENINGKDIKQMVGTFRECTNLIKAPTIPKTVVNMDNTFGGCISLTDVSVIPKDVSSMNNTFKNCTALTIGPEIPDSVKYMSYTFENCSALTSVSNIPNGVYHLNRNV